MNISINIYRSGDSNSRAKSGVRNSTISIKKILILAGLLALGTGAQAQPGQGQRQNQDRQGPPTEQMINKAKEQLGLSDEQFVEWKSVHAELGVAMSKIKDRRSDEAKALRYEFEKKVAAILNEEQLAKFKEQYKKGSERKPGGKRKG